MSSEVWKKGARSIHILQGDITREKVDAIVNAANAQLAGGGGVDGAIHRAGGPSLLQECKDFMKNRGPLVRGEAMATGGGRLNARHVIHTAGPVFRGGHDGEEAHLRECYANSLRLAVNLGAKSVAFPAISCGVYRYPFEQAMRVALEETAAFLESPDVSGEFEVHMVQFDGSHYADALAVADRLFGPRSA